MTAAYDGRDRLVIAAHHPERLDRPVLPASASDTDRFQQTLTWNVFRTLELLSPSFWLRRFHARLIGEAPPTAPHILNVSLWRTLPLPPIQRLDGATTNAIADVVIETEHAVWTLLVAADGDPWQDYERRAAPIVDAGAWLAGSREHYSGLIAMHGDGATMGDVVRARYSRSRLSASVRSATRGPTHPIVSAYGALTWADLLCVLRDCVDANCLPAIERALAANAVDWLDRADLRAPRSRLTLSN